ncbi:MAG TPA: hypothetical protein PKN24_16480, partial [bacterium]|nr:hypothetical protein [bacterium]
VAGLSRNQWQVWPGIRILRIKLKRLVYNAQENIIASGLKLSTPTIKGILTEMIGLGNQNAQNSLKTLIDEGL